ncbi:hypothetical protein M422DRAFT_174728, partial [Sphaerobolus stellatus SS14]
TYSIHVQPENDPYLIAADKVLRAFEVAGVPGTFLVDIFPCSTFAFYFLNMTIC